MNASACPCGCSAPAGSIVHAINAALVADDLDAAIEHGLLSVTPCPACRSECRQRFDRARNQRLGALAARDRFRARQARLQRLAEERAARRAPAPATVDDGDSQRRPPLPGAAAAALARAKARAAGRSRS